MWKCSLVLLTLCLGEHQAEARRYHEYHHRNHHRSDLDRPVSVDCKSDRMVFGETGGVKYPGASGSWVVDYSDALYWSVYMTK